MPPHADVARTLVLWMHDQYRVTHSVSQGRLREQVPDIVLVGEEQPRAAKQLDHTWQGD
jgi:hypothetical protein